MAEIAAGAWAAEEVVSTTAQAGVAAYMVSKPTLPLKATFTQIAPAPDAATQLSLARSNHTVSVVDDKAYLFGGETGDGKVATTDVHVVTLAPSEKAEPEYALLPAVPATEGGGVPSPRTRHAAGAFNVCVAVYGGCDESGRILEDESTIWLFNTAKSAWETLRASSSDHSPGARSGARLFAHQNKLILHSGSSSDGKALTDTWFFDYTAKTWTKLPDAPVATSNVAFTDGSLYLISGSDSVSGDLHSLHIPGNQSEQPSWTTTSFPTNPLTPGPRPRIGGGLVPVTTGHGRHYLLYFFGARQTATLTAPDPNNSDEPTQWSDMWTIQLPSSQAVSKPTSSFTDALKPAAIKDAIRSKLGYDSGEHRWAEVEVQPPTDLGADEVGGKLHPGPRAFFGCDVMEDGTTMLMWGGVNARGEREGDGWMVQLC